MGVRGESPRVIEQFGNYLLSNQVCLFVLGLACEINPKTLEDTLPQFQSLGWSGPMAKRGLELGENFGMIFLLKTLRRIVLYRVFSDKWVGMGHYARMSISRKSKGRARVSIVFFTIIMYCTHYMGRLYSLPPSNRQKFDGMDARTWNLQCEEMLANVFSVRPSTLSDGAYPYRGILMIKSRNDLLRIWVRRINRSGKDNAPADSYDHFQWFRGI